MESRQKTVVLEKTTRETKLPAPDVISEMPTNEGAGRGKGEDPTVAKSAANLSAPRSQVPGQVEVSLPIVAADIGDASANAEGVLDVLQQDVPGSSVAAPPFEGSHGDFSIDDVADPTMVLFLDSQLHPDKIACML